MMTEPFSTQYHPEQQAERPYSLMAILSLVLGILFLCFGPLALIPLILGIVALTNTGSGGAKKGMGFAIAGVSLGGVGVLGTCMSVGILLPALGAARNKANQIVSEVQVRELVQGVLVFADQDEVFPTQEQWPDALVDLGLIMPDSLMSPAEDGDGLSYIYVPGPLSQDAFQILVYEDPKHFYDGVVVGFADGHVELVDHDVFERMLAEQLAAQEVSP